MHDFSLGPPVDVGRYDGLLLDGKPLHSGNCEDGVYGCRKCSGAMRRLSPEQLEQLGVEDSQECYWCNKSVPLKDICGLRPWDEPSVYYEVCTECWHKHNRDEDVAFGDDIP